MIKFVYVLSESSLSRVQMHWICQLICQMYKLSTCWVLVEVLGVFKWPQQWLNMLSVPKISQRLMMNHGWESEVYSSPQNTKMLGCISSKPTHSWGQKGKKRCGKTRAWIRRRSSKGCYNYIVKDNWYVMTPRALFWHLIETKYSLTVKH